MRVQRKKSISSSEVENTESIQKVVYHLVEQKALVAYFAYSDNVGIQVDWK